MADDNNSMAILKFKIQACFKVLDKFSWLLDAYVLNFFTENHLEILPETWKTSMNLMSLNEFEYLLSCSSSILKNVWPLSVLCVKVLVQNLSLSRKVDDKPEAFLFHANNKKLRFECFSQSFNHPTLQSLLFKHVKPKKRYEIFKVAQMVTEELKKLKVKFVVDVGSGLGHLSRMLAYGFRLRVCSIETQPQLLRQAEKLDLEFEKVAEKYLSLEELEMLKKRRPVRWNQTIDCNLSSKEFSLRVRRLLGESEQKASFGIVGLHPCGDLAVSLLDIFAECPEARFVALIGCCYHKLSAAGDTNNYTGFPISVFCNENKVQLSYEARALACHAIESYSQRLKFGPDHHLKIHCYRAALEKLIHKHWPQLQKKAVGNVKSNSELNFEKYCHIALDKLNVTLSQEDFKSQEISQSLAQWEFVAKFYTFRLMLAPLIETLVLLDRKLYLLEKGLASDIVAAFDPEVSPRNQLLLSEKT